MAPITRIEASYGWRRCNTLRTQLREALSKMTRQLSEEISEMYSVIPPTQDVADLDMASILNTNSGNVDENESLSVKSLRDLADAVKLQRFYLCVPLFESEKQAAVETVVADFMSTQEKVNHIFQRLTESTKILHDRLERLLSAGTSFKIDSSMQTGVTLGCTQNHSSSEMLRHAASLDQLLHTIGIKLKIFCQDLQDEDIPKHELMKRFDNIGLDLDSLRSDWEITREALQRTLFPASNDLAAHAEEESEPLEPEAVASIVHPWNESENPVFEGPEEVFEATIIDEPPAKKVHPHSFGSFCLLSEKAFEVECLFSLSTVDPGGANKAKQRKKRTRGIQKMFIGLIQLSMAPSLNDQVCFFQSKAKQEYMKKTELVEELRNVLTHRRPETKDIPAPPHPPN
ncbi:hypothetical protein HK102_003606 [Quaeritorhiza haematococci]|nr:hypothetical protein HK102_003606 [Quaeritorhiza haematococci]